MNEWIENVFELGFKAMINTVVNTTKQMQQKGLKIKIIENEMLSVTQINALTINWAQNKCFKSNNKFSFEQVFKKK